MASVITATTSSGLVSSADNSGVLQLASGTGNLVTVPSVTGTAMVSGNMPAFSAYLSANQSISANTFTKAQFDTEEFDTANCFNTSTYRFTPNVAGYYQVNLTIYTSGVGSTAGNAYIYKNGASFKAGVATASNNQVVPVPALIYLNGSSDYIEAYSYVSSGTSIVIAGTVGNAPFCYFQAVLVRAA